MEVHDLYRNASRIHTSLRNSGRNQLKGTSEGIRDKTQRKGMKYIINQVKFVFLSREYKTKKKKQFFSFLSARALLFVAMVVFYM